MSYLTKLLQEVQELDSSVACYDGHDTFLEMKQLFISMVASAIELEKRPTWYVITKRVEETAAEALRRARAGRESMKDDPYYLGQIQVLDHVIPMVCALQVENNKLSVELRDLKLKLALGGSK